MIDPYKLKVGDCVFYDESVERGIMTFGKVTGLSGNCYFIDWTDLGDVSYEYDDPSDFSWHKHCIIINERDKLAIQLKHGDKITDSSDLY